MTKKKKTDPVIKARKTLREATGTMSADRKNLIEEAMARTMAARDAAKAQERLAKAAGREARARGEELLSMVEAAKSEARAQAKAEKAAKRAKKAAKKLPGKPIDRSEAAVLSAQPPIG
jgi:hypothetical protein